MDWTVFTGCVPSVSRRPEYPMRPGLCTFISKGNVLREGDDVQLSPAALWWRKRWSNAMKAGAGRWQAAASH